MVDSSPAMTTNNNALIMQNIFFFGEWQINPAANTLLKQKLQYQLEPKAMELLLLLCSHAGEVVTTDEIINRCWSRLDTGDNPLHKTLAQLRKALGDSATQPRYIETIRKRGYRAIAEVRFPVGQEQSVNELSWQQGSPFPGLQAYGARYASVFFGRGAQISTLLSRIAQQVKFGRAFCLLLGPSGSGKSSLVHAGVLPNLMQTGGYHGIEVLSYSSLDLADVAPRQLLLNLASTLLDWELQDEPVLTGYSAEQLAAALTATPELILNMLSQALQNGRQGLKRLALFVDRLEVLLSSPLFNETERSQFISLLEQLACSNSVLVLSACRNEFYPLLVNYPTLMAGKARGAHFDLAAPTRNDLLQMIRLPALAAGLGFDIDPDTAIPLDEILCSEAASNPDALPMLQYTLQQLYLQRSSDNKLQVATYKKLGGIEGAIGKNAEQAICTLTETEQASLPAVLSLLVTLREDEQSITSRTARFSQLNTDAERTLVQTLVEQRLFVSHLQQGEPCFSVAHEALLRRWPRATAWISEHHDSLRIKSRLQHLQQRWQVEQGNSAYLLAPGKPLQEALQLKRNPLFQLDTAELAFIEASAQKARQKRWLRHGTIAALCLLTVTAFAMSFKSYNAEQQAQQKRLAAENLLGFMVGEFADKLRSIGRMDLLDGISNKALEYFTDFSNSSTLQSTAAMLQHGQTLTAMGEVAYSRGKIDEASAALQAGRSQLEAALKLQPTNLELLKTLGANAFWLGQIQYDASNWQGTQHEFQRYYQYSELMYELAPDSLDAIMELSYATNSLGSLAIKQQQFAIARENFEESLRLKLLAQAKQPENTQLLADIADTRSWLASATLAEGNLLSAITIHKALQNDLVLAEVKEPYLLDILSSSYQILADFLSYQGDFETARAFYLEGYRTLAKALEQDPDNSRWQRRKHLLDINALNFSINDDITAIEQHVSSLKHILTSGPTQLSDSQRKELLSRLWLTTGVKLHQINQIALSENYTDLAVSGYSELSENFPLNRAHYIALLESQLLQAKTRSVLHGQDKAVVICRNIKERLADIIENNKCVFRFVRPPVPVSSGQAFRCDPASMI
ncbi:winged helix-turn-helix domain-containing protein [Alishewanella jeotgali]|uniref:Lysine decarboxylase transcriptional regulator, CadC n=1 Tax=Alishewanella jeotgali KCTC 22429 TaxID=1129374 RepID=H3ZEH1_9ALTE|nr:winged helix-turn-helix domain-containing protein [Alishewanella jeotgali]EHR40934.1 lysine decarboxylase transcriptional regulator, CadC [Alishewanella jeotgali KCTC 22429]